MVSPLISLLVASLSLSSPVVTAESVPALMVVQAKTTEALLEEGMALTARRQTSAALIIYQYLLKRAEGNLSLEALVYLGLGKNYTLSGQLVEAQKALERALSLSVSLQSSLLEADALSYLGITLGLQGNDNGALSFLAKALPLSRKVKSRAIEADVLNNFGLVYLNQGNYEKALNYFLQSLPISQEIEDYSLIADTLTSIAQVYLAVQSLNEAESLLKQSLVMRQKLGDFRGEAHTLQTLSIVYWQQQLPDLSSAALQEALRLYETVNDLVGQASALRDLGVMSVVLGEQEAAINYFERALPIVEAQGETDVVGQIRERLRELRSTSDQQPPSSISTNSTPSPTVDQEKHLAEVEILLEQKNFNELILLAQQALTISQELLGDKHPDTALALNNLAGLYLSQGNFANAASLYEKALAIRKEILGEKHPDTAASLNSIGFLNYSKGDYATAELFYKQALATRKEILGEKHPDTIRSLNNLATSFDKQGNYAAAEPLYKKALEIRKEVLGEKHPETALSLNNLAHLYFIQGNYTVADSFFQKALVIQKEILGEKHPDTIRSLNNLATSLDEQGNYVAAEPLYRKVLEIRREVLGEKHPDTAITLNNLAALYYSQGNYSDAESLSQQALVIQTEVLGEKHPQTAIFLNNLASIYRAQGKYPAAAPFAQKALAIQREFLGEKHPDIAISLNNLAILRWATEDIPSSLVFLQQGTDIEENNLAIFLNQIGDESRKQAYIKTIAKSIDWTISLHLNHTPNNPDAAELALNTILRRKGRVLDALSNTVALLRQRLTPDIQAIFDDLSTKRSQLASLSFQGPGDRPVEVYKQQLDTLNQEIQRLESQLSNQSTEFRTENQLITVDAVQNLLPQDSALLEYIVYNPYNPKTQTYGKPRYAAYILRPNGDPIGIDLGDAADIDQLIVNWLQTLNNAPGKTLPFQRRAEKDQKAVGAVLEAKILAPLRPYLNTAQHLLIAPDSQLNLIPFAALPQGETGKYLIEDYQITFLTSGRDLLKLQNPVPPRSPSLVMGNPNYGAQPPVKTEEGDRSADIGKLNAWCCNALPGTAKEVAGLRPLFLDAQIYTDQDAGIDKLVTIKAPPVLHLATHGFFLPDNPSSPVEEKPILTGSLNDTLKPDLSDNPLLRSGLAFTGFNPKENKYDGALTALEATTLDLWGTKLVVLSACQTGVGDVRNGEGVYGLRRAFVLAGAESQVMSLWNVSDMGTQNLMVKYYQNLQQGLGRSEALRRVQLELLQGEEYPNPYYWAAFIPSGDWRPFSLK
jgi:CHAT domain-containing protein/Tfp pilus assembly protein PilF